MILTKKKGNAKDAKSAKSAKKMIAWTTRLLNVSSSWRPWRLGALGVTLCAVQELDAPDKSPGKGRPGDLGSY